MAVPLTRRKQSGDRAFCVAGPKRIKTVADQSGGSNMFRTLAVVMALGAAMACGDGSPAQPAAPSQTTVPDSSGRPVVRLDVKADESGARDAIALLSEVIVDASASTGSGALTYSIDFGDGASATGATARHVYTTPGTFTVTAEARDSQGRTASATQQVVVKTLGGSWFHASYVPRAGRVEVRRLTITSQEGLTIRGLYRVTGAPDRPFTGTLTAPRNVQILVDNAVALSGAIPSRLTEDAEPWPLQMRGDGVDGLRLDFRPVVGEPVPPEPDAVLRVRFDSFGAAAPIVALSPIEFDASASRGAGLSYFIEFGDRQFSTEARAIHRVDQLGQLTAHLTVVDRFGRVDAESLTYSTRALHNWPGDGWLNTDADDKFFFLDFLTRNGVNYEGTALHAYAMRPGRTASFRATLSGERDIHIVIPELGLEFRGHVELAAQSTFRWRMIVTQTGGAGHGTTWTLQYDDGPG
jgi:hypothetical protein